MRPPRTDIEAQEKIAGVEENAAAGADGLGCNTNGIEMRLTKFPEKARKVI